MSDHICTTESFSTGETMNGECLVCLYKGKLNVTYVGVLCPKCKYCTDNEFMGTIAKKRRELLKLTKRQIAQKLGYTTNQIKYFETERCFIEYYEKTEELVKKHKKVNK